MHGPALAYSTGPIVSRRGCDVTEHLPPCIVCLGVTHTLHRMLAVSASSGHLCMRGSTLELSVGCKEHLQMAEAQPLALKDFILTLFSMKKHCLSKGHINK